MLISYIYIKCTLYDKKEKRLCVDKDLIQEGFQDAAAGI